MKNKTLWIMCGAPGVGKSYVATRYLMHGSGWSYVSRDAIRFEFLDEDEDYFAHENEVFEIFVYRLAQALKDGEIFDVIADATHLHWPSRRKLLTALSKEVNLNDYNIICVVVKSDERTCRMRNNERGGREQVPDGVLTKMWKSWHHPKNDPFNYDAIMEWDNETEDWSKGD